MTPNTETTAFALFAQIFPLIEAFKKQKKQFIWVGIAGAPGSGKSTLCKFLKDVLDAERIPCASIAMDGFHLFAHELDKSEDAAELHKRRGSPWTFNPDLMLSRLKKLRDSAEGDIIAFPIFDHAIGDPEECGNVFTVKEFQVVLVEGNYILLKSSPWSEIASFFNYSVMLKCPKQILVQRLSYRHQLAFNITFDEAKKRVEANDLKNADIVYEESIEADIVLNDLKNFPNQT